MGRKRIPGLIMRAGIWHVDKRVFGWRVCQSTGTTQLAEAEQYLARVMEETRQAQVYGVRPTRTFEQAAAKFVLENQHKRSIADDVGRLKDLMPFIGAIALDRLHMGTCSRGSTSERRQGRTAGTINHGLQIVRRILNLAAAEWVDEQGLTWLSRTAQDQAVAQSGQAPALSVELGRADTAVSASCLPISHKWRCSPSIRAAEIAKSAACAGSGRSRCRNSAPRSSLFLAARVKNGDERLVVLNRVARSVVEARRGQHPTHVFTYEGKPVRTDVELGLEKARQRSGLPDGSGARLEAHVRPSPASGRGELRGSSGSARTSLGADHDALFGSRTFAPHRGGRNRRRAERKET